MILPLMFWQMRDYNIDDSLRTIIVSNPIVKNLFRVSKNGQRIDFEPQERSDKK